MEEFKHGENKEKMELETVRDRLRKKVEDIKQKAAKNPHCVDWMLADVKVDELTDNDLRFFLRGEKEENLERFTPDEMVGYRTREIIPHMKQVGKKKEIDDINPEDVQRQLFKDSRVVFFDWMAQRWNFFQYLREQNENVVWRKYDET